jgi:hypothetical protein
MSFLGKLFPSSMPDAENKLRSAKLLSAWVSNGVLLETVLPILCLTIVLPFTNSLAASPTDCQKMTTDVEQKKQRLLEYSKDLHRENANGNQQALGELNNKINELIRQIRVTEDSMESCLSVESIDATEGFSPSKSDEEQYMAKDCDELKLMVIPLRRTINRLERRELSQLSQISRSEKAQLMEARRKIAKVRAALEIKCSPIGSRYRKR